MTGQTVILLKISSPKTITWIGRRPTKFPGVAGFGWEEPERIQRWNIIPDTEVVISIMPTSYSDRARAANHLGPQPPNAKTIKI